MCSIHEMFTISVTSKARSTEKTEKEKRKRFMQASVTRLVRQYSRGCVLAIGDGGNDVAMIQVRIFSSVPSQEEQCLTLIFIEVLKL